jgi:hypothetical protein
MFECHEEFLDQDQRKRDKLGKRMMYERKQQMREKHLKVPPHWILGTNKRELICLSYAAMKHWMTSSISMI